jgi:ketosteroid isomerase-like protein
MNTDFHDFEQFMKQREDAARAYVRGDAAPLGRLVTHEGQASFFGPQGGYRQGADEVFSTYTRDATSFAPGGDTHFEILDMAASDGIAYWVGFQHASVYMQGGGEAVPMTLRVTEVFRREGDAWKMVHRHADALPIEPKQKK